MSETIEITSFDEKFIYLTPPHAPVLMSTMSKFGNTNLAPFEQFMGCSDFPPRATIAISPKSDTISNLNYLDEFCIGIPTPALAKQVLVCGEKIPQNESEFEFSGLTPEPSKLIAPPRIKECPINFECKLYWKKEAGDHILVVGSILLIAVDKEVYKADKIERRTGLDMLYYATSGYFMRKGEVFKP